MGIKITIKPGSETAHAFKKYMADKAAFKQAVMSGNITSYVKQKGKKFDTPIPVSK